MASLINEKKTRFFMGVAYRFVRVGVGEWICINSDLVPAAIVEEIKKEWD